MHLIDFIICDDIRRELGNKVSIMGIYTESINISVPSDTKWPIAFRLGVYVRIEFDKLDPAPDRFIIKASQDDKHLAQLSGNIISPANQSSHTLAIPIVMNPLPLNGFGVVRLDVEIFKGSESLLAETHSIEVIQAKTPLL
jgi:Family of unknown function (DUF6941)